MDIREEFLNVIDALTSAEVDYAVCGGIAMLFHGYPRLTTDIDLLVSPQDVDRVKDLAASVGFVVAPPQPIVFGAGSDSETRVLRVSKFEGEDHLVLDLILVDHRLASVWRTRERHTLEGRSVSVVSACGLIQMKRATGRKQDEADVERLLGRDD